MRTVLGRAKGSWKHVGSRKRQLTVIKRPLCRQKRPGEVNGVDYWFVSKAEFETWIQDGRLLEHAVVYGEYKGIPLDQVTAHYYPSPALALDC